jgi:glycosyltransferase involved in cell wall biosynthesis
MKFWIVTPSYNQIGWLKLCVASIRDQVSDEGIRHSALGAGEKGSEARGQRLTANSSISVHHHVQDACSTDGTREFLAEYESKIRAFGVGRSASGNDERSDNQNVGPNAQCLSPSASLSGYSFSYSSEKDNGMYDAINRGWKRAPDDVDVIAHLNCDEQYLPGALRTIAEFFMAHQKADVVLADMIVVDNDGAYICHRRSLQPYAFTSRFCCGGFTATTFQRSSVTKEKGVLFDTSWRNFGDKVWYNALHRAGCCFAVCNQIVSTFADTGENMNWTEEGQRERQRYDKEFLRGIRAGTVVVSRFLGLRRVIKERLIKPPESYSLYRNASSDRETLPVANPTGLWHKRWKG